MSVLYGEYGGKIRIEGDEVFVQFTEREAEQGPTDRKDLKDIIRVRGEPAKAEPFFLDFYVQGKVRISDSRDMRHMVVVDAGELDAHL